jgi:pyruvate/2-oxoglutarate dehydrogenase complex dihydrolipoamide dehydrogenase (E3) component
MKRRSGASSYDGFTPDLVVIGGGMGGVSAALRANELGARVLLAEPAAIGGT